MKIQGKKGVWGILEIKEDERKELIINCSSRISFVLFFFSVLFPEVSPTTTVEENPRTADGSMYMYKELKSRTHRARTRFSDKEN